MIHTFVYISNRLISILPFSLVILAFFVNQSGGAKCYKKAGGTHSRGGTSEVNYTYTQHAISLLDYRVTLNYKILMLMEWKSYAPLDPKVFFYYFEGVRQK